MEELDKLISNIQSQYDETVGAAKKKYDEMLGVIQEKTTFIDEKMKEYTDKGEQWIELHKRSIKRVIDQKKEEIDNLTKQAQDWLEDRINDAAKKMNDKMAAEKADIEAKIKQKADKAKEQAEETAKIKAENAVKLKVPMVPGLPIDISTKFSVKEPDMSMFDPPERMKYL